MAKFSLADKLLGFIHLTRPLEWSKTLMNMLFGAFLAVQALPNISLFILGFIAAGPLLWGGLYTLNDLTDIEKDKKHKVKKGRPLAKGIVSRLEGQLFAFVLLFAALVIAYNINFLFFACIIVMIANQFAYTLKPLRLKERPFLDIISGSMINPVFRFFAGWTLFAATFDAPLLFLVFIVGVQSGGFVLYRLSGKKLEQKLGYQSSFAVLGEKNVKRTAYALIFLGGVSFVAITLSDFLPTIVPFGALPLKFFWLVIGSALLLPFYWPTFQNPQKMDLKKMYDLVYIHNILFLVGFVVLWLI